MIYKIYLKKKKVRTYKELPRKEKLKEFITIKPVSYDILKGLLQEEKKKIKKLNNKMAIYACQQLNLKTKNKQAEQKETHRYREHFDGGQMGVGGEDG